MKRQTSSSYRQLMRRLGSEDARVNHSGGVSHAYRSLSEVAAILGITRQAVSQIERVAINKLRLAMIDEMRELRPSLARELENGASHVV